jgi:hypothetical protein
VGNDMTRAMVIVLHRFPRRRALFKAGSVARA